MVYSKKNTGSDDWQGFVAERLSDAIQKSDFEKTLSWARSSVFFAVNHSNFFEIFAINGFGQWQIFGVHSKIFETERGIRSKMIKIQRESMQNNTNSKKFRLRRAKLKHYIFTTYTKLLLLIIPAGDENFRKIIISTRISLYRTITEFSKFSGRLPAARIRELFFISPSELFYFWIRKK